MIRRLVALAGVGAIPAAAVRLAVRRGTTRLLDAPRVGPDEAALGPAIDALGGEVVRLRSRDGLRLAGRWLAVERDGSGAGVAADAWAPDPHEAIVLLHGWTGSVAPDLVELAPGLRRTAGVLGLDFRGHGESDPAPTTFGLHEVEDVAGALAWLGERGVTRVALVGTSMGGIVALASIVVLGDGTLASADADPDAPSDVTPPPRPRIVGAVAESIAPELATSISGRIRLPFRRFLAARMFDEASRRLGGDPRATEPGRIVGLVEGVPLLLIHGDADDLIPLEEGRRLVALAGPGVEHWVVPGAGHSRAHQADPAAWDARVGTFLRRAFADAREAVPIIAPPVEPVIASGGGQEGD